MTIQTTLGEILDRADWDKYCEISGTSVWACNEGGADVDVTLDEETAKTIGFIKE